MSVTSIEFILFILVLTILYYVFPQKIKPYLILIGSAIFYLTFNYVFAVYLLLTVLTTYIAAIQIELSENKQAKKSWLVSVLTLNITLLLVLKYLPYFANLLDPIFPARTIGLSFVVPIGISFYTLQTIGYCIDVFRGDTQAERHLFKYMSFATFFPLILQGPISRYNQLAHQLFKINNPNDIYFAVTHGSQLLLWGLFKKLVIADRAGILVGEVFNNHTNYMAWPILVASLLYTLQIYADFSGFVDISRGIGQLFGIDIIPNFRQPYFAVSIADFWRRWHMSLSSWLRDYVYIPLGGNRKGIRRKYINIVIVFLISGLWHGVGLQFIAWGLLHGLYQITGALTQPFKQIVSEKIGLSYFSKNMMRVRRLMTFALLVISWVFFRSENLVAALRMVKRLFFDWSGTQYEIIYELGLDYFDFYILGIGVILILTEWIMKENKIRIRNLISEQPLVVRWSVYLSAILIIVVFGIYGPGFSDSSFIYMNF